MKKPTSIVLRCEGPVPPEWLRTQPYVIWEGGRMTLTFQVEGPMHCLALNLDHLRVVSVEPPVSEVPPRQAFLDDVRDASSGLARPA